MQAPPLDLAQLFFNALWIIGLAVILAAFSINQWRAQANGAKLRRQLETSAFQTPLTIGLILVSLSLALTADVWWQRTLWGAFAALFAAQWWFDQKRADATE